MIHHNHNTLLWSVPEMAVRLNGLHHPMDGQDLMPTDSPAHPTPQHTKPKWLLLKSLLTLILAGTLSYLLWNPGIDVRDGRHDLGHNGVWMAHGWLGDDAWFLQNQKTNQIPLYRDPAKIQAKADFLRLHGITDVFPHLCPTFPSGHLPDVNSNQVERFLDHFHGFRVMPWVGGANGATAHHSNSRWRSRFVSNIRRLLTAHPRLAGIHINLEPMPTGDPDFLKLLDELRAALPAGKWISVAAYPPPTRWHPHPEVHWDEPYFRSVAQRVDQMAVMMYDAGQRIPKTYTQLMADWTQQILDWSGNTSVLLGVPTYSDEGVEYHHPSVENLNRALPGIHRGLSRRPTLPSHYQGVAIYCDWETSPEEWQQFKTKFLKHNPR